MTSDINLTENTFMEKATLKIESSKMTILTKHTSCRESNTFKFLFETEIKVNVENIDGTISIENIGIAYCTKAAATSECCEFEILDGSIISVRMPVYDKKSPPDLRIKKEINVLDNDVLKFYNNVRDELLNLKHNSDFVAQCRGHVFDAITHIIPVDY